MSYYEHRLPCDATQIGRFRVVVGEAGLEQMLKATINTAVEIKALKPEELERVIQAVQATAACAQASAHDPGCGHARGAAQVRSA